MNPRETTLEAILERRVSAIIRAGERDLARDAMKAAVEGGFRVIEFTMTTPDALGLVEEFAADDELIVGAGTVMSPADVGRATDAGARFIVSPVCDPDVIAEGRRRDRVTIPGTFTATEMLAATRAGADMVKLFPAPADVADYIKSILGPMPELKIFPTNGVTEENFAAVMRAGAAGVGFVRALFDPEAMARRDYKGIERRARRLIGLLEEFAPTPAGRI
jgi:2-dehydro-3-deoxyphosphogluconate aldolase/(4S)-4-hydroxy-2-oxoglutarate aldolase